MRWSGSPPCALMSPPKAGKPNKGEQMVRYGGSYSPAVGAGSGSTEEGKRGGISALHPADREIIQRVPLELGKNCPIDSLQRDRLQQLSETVRIS